jgi:hypothetical protein
MSPPFQNRITLWNYYATSVNFLYRGDHFGHDLFLRPKKSSKKKLVVHSVRLGRHEKIPGSLCTIVADMKL